MQRRGFALSCVCGDQAGSLGVGEESAEKKCLEVRWLPWMRNQVRLLLVLDLEVKEEQVGGRTVGAGEVQGWANGGEWWATTA